MEPEGEPGMLDYKILDNKNEFTVEQAAFYWFEKDPNEPEKAREIMPKIKLMENVLNEAAHNHRVYLVCISF